MSKTAADIAIEKPVIDERVVKLEAVAMECCKPGAVSSSGFGVARKDYVADGVVRWCERIGKDGLLRRWKRAPVNAADKVDTDAYLVGVSDDCDGWLVIGVPK